MFTYRVWYQYQLDGVPKSMTVKAENPSEAERAAKKILEIKLGANVKLMNVEQV